MTFYTKHGRQNPRNRGSIVYMMLCRNYIINNILATIILKEAV